MPNMKSAIKRVKVTAKKKELNNDFKTSMRTAMKKTEKAVVAKDATLAKTNLNEAIKKIDKAYAKGLVHKNYVARQKSRLTKNVNEVK